jgi:hypothetical protein
MVKAPPPRRRDNIMARKVNWYNMEKAQKDLKRKVKNITMAGDYLKDKPGKGMFKDNISKNVIEIDKAKTSSLRRYIKLLDNYFYLVTSKNDRDWILGKKVEIETVLNNRDDVVVKRVDNE